MNSACLVALQKALGIVERLLTMERQFLFERWLQIQDTFIHSITMSDLFGN